MKFERLYFLILFSILTVFATSCEDKKSPQDTLFQKIPSSQSGLDFRNDLSFDKAFNIFTYRNYYNGGGVALGDINNDGLLDIYLTANLGPNKLYLNKGDFQFEDITEEAGVAGTSAWSTGVSMADVNGDGLLDIYVCNSGDISGDKKQNELFINNGDGTFSEQAAAYGLDDQGFSTHAVFFDYDNDGDLDLYLLNNSYQAIGSFNKMQEERSRRDPVGGDKLFRNDGDSFTDVSEEAGIFGSTIGFGLGITIGDVNRDGWQDIFISNDFFEKDYLYINNQDGTFSESLESYMQSISAASMGADIADINNNGLLDIFVTDMLPEPPERLKQVTTFENWDRFMFNKKHGYHYQYTRNMLHVNNGNGTFSELGRLAGVEATDWSWAALIFDMDNDGLKDVFIANGIYQDITDLDYLNFIDNEETKRKIIQNGSVDYRALIDPIPITPIPNYAFKNKGDLSFENVAGSWGLADPIHSNGSAYGDLNNDGSMDLVINNVNEEVLLFKNTSRQKHPENHYFRVDIMGKDKNTAAIGSQVFLKAGEQVFYQEKMPNRGFQSSVDPRLLFGLGAIDEIDEVLVRFPDGKVWKGGPYPADQSLSVSWEEAKVPEPGFHFFPPPPDPLFREVMEDNWLDFKHEENSFVDFDRERLIYHKNSTEGPAFAAADVNGDGLEDLYFGGAKDRPGKLFLQQKNGRYKEQTVADFEVDKGSEDVHALFFDANGDGMLDLMVCSGGTEFGVNSPDLADRLYLNDGKGTFRKSKQPAFVKNAGSSAVAAVEDLNGDGFPDLFVGSRLKPFGYGVSTSSYIYINDGKGGFEDRTKELAPELENIGMVTDAAWLDIDGDGKQDLVLVGDWMAPTFFKNTGAKLAKEERPEFEKYKGWYRSLSVGDLTNNGKPDLILGNLGLNARFKASEEEPICMFVNDFDSNGSLEQVYTRKTEQGHIPFTLKHELEMQLPKLKKRYLKYAAYNSQSMEEIFSSEDLEHAHKQEANFLQSAVMINQGGGEFTLKPLPMEAQKTWMYAIQLVDLNKDGNLDIIMGGNLYGVKPQMGKYDASFGEVLLGNGQGDFKALSYLESGMGIRGDIRHFHVLEKEGKKVLMAIRNNAEPKSYWLP